MGRGGALALRGTAGTDGALGTVGGLAAIFGGAGGVARGTIGLRRARGRVILLGAGRAATARFIRDGAFSLNPPVVGAALARGVAFLAGANRDLVRWPVFGINRERTAGRSNCGTFCGGFPPNASRTLRSTDTEPAWRWACAVGGVISAAVRKANAAAAKPRGATAAMCRRNLGAINSTRIMNAYPSLIDRHRTRQHSRERVRRQPFWRDVKQATH